MDMRTCFT